MMKLILKLPEGAEETRDIVAATIVLKGWTLEISPEGEPMTLLFHTPSKDEKFASFVTHHRSANTMALEIRQHKRKYKPMN
jgi:hypothetical protein